MIGGHIRHEGDFDVPLVGLRLPDVSGSWSESTVGNLGSRLFQPATSLLIFLSAMFLSMNLATWATAESIFCIFFRLRNRLLSEKGNQHRQQCWQEKGEGLRDTCFMKTSFFSSESWTQV